MTGRQLDVTVNGQLVGHLRENNDLWEFEYSPEWATSTRGFDLSPELPCAQAVHTDGASKRPVQWYFDNLLPEGLRGVIAKESNLSAEDAFGLLTHFGAESAGSLVLHDPHHASALPASAEQGLKPLPLAGLSQRISNLPRVSLTRDAPKKMSLAGAQHKMLVVLRGDEGDHEENELFEPLPGTPSTHILKPNHPGDDYPASVMNEYFSMRLAKAVGLDVPEVRRMYVPQPVYLVERFDRIKGKNTDEVQRRHVIDTCQLLGKARSFKYSAAHLDTLVQAVMLCRSRAVARLQLYRWIVFNVLIGNGDNHLKNISFLADAAGVNVAPAYDLLCTAVYETRAMASEKARWPDTALAFSLGNAKTFATLTRAHVLEAGHALGLAATTAKRELNLFIKAVPLEADKLIADIEAHNEKEVAASPDLEVARADIGGEMRMLRAIRHIVLADMAQQLA